MEEHPPLTETIISFLVLAMVAAQAWVVINEATDGDAGRWARNWWATVGRPAVVRVVIWVDAAAIADQMVVEEIEPFLRERHGNH